MKYARIGAVATLSLACVAPGAALAQGAPPQRFDTFSAALNALLLPNTNFFSPPDGTACALGIPAGDLFEDPDVGLTLRNDAPIGQSLANHCDNDPENINAGGILSGGLSSSQATRTVSTFTTRQPRRTEQSDDDQTRSLSSFAPIDPIANLFGAPGTLILAAETPDAAGESAASLPAGELQFFGDRFSVFASFEYQDITNKASAFENRSEIETFRGVLGAAFRVTSDIAVGVTGRYRHGDGELIIDSAIGVDTDFDGVADFGLDYEQTCGVSRFGDTEDDEWGGSVFSTARIGQSGFVSAEVGASHLDQEYSQSRCLLSAIRNEDEPPLISELFAGTVSGDPEGTRVFGELIGGADFPVGRVILGPRGQLSIDHTHVGGYSERETPSAGISPDSLDPDGGVVNDTTGTALVYDDQDFTSVQTRIGGLVAVPFALGEGTVTPFGEAMYVHEFLNDQRDIEVRFVEDRRADPLQFSFKNNSPDRDFFELGGGVDADIGGLVQAIVKAKTVIGNSRFDGYTVNAAVRIPF